MRINLYYKGVRIKIDAYLEEKNITSEDSKRVYDRYSMSVECLGKRRVFEHYHSDRDKLIAGEEAAKALSSVLYMANMGSLSFDEFCERTKVSNDSIKAKNTWEKAKGIYSNVRNVMPYDFSLSELEKYFEDYKDLTDEHLKLELKELLEKYNASISVDRFEEEPGDIILSRIREDGVDHIVKVFGRTIGIEDLI